jgi:hypothetical protein
LRTPVRLPELLARRRFRGLLLPNSGAAPLRDADGCHGDGGGMTSVITPTTIPAIGVYNMAAAFSGEIR